MRGNKAYIMEACLRWTGHVVCTSAERLPRALLYSELSDGARKVGAPKMRFKDQLKSSLSKCDITDFEVLANDRGLWKTAVKTGVARFENARIEDLKDSRCCRKERVSVQGCYPYDRCPKVCLSRIGPVNLQRAHNRKGG